MLSAYSPPTLRCKTHECVHLLSVVCCPSCNCNAYYAPAFINFLWINRHRTTALTGLVLFLSQIPLAFFYLAYLTWSLTVIFFQIFPITSSHHAVVAVCDGLSPCFDIRSEYVACGIAVSPGTAFTLRRILRGPLLQAVNLGPAR